jgi:hypothetical protein
LAVVNTEAWNSRTVQGLVVSMMNKLSAGTFATSSWRYPGGSTPRARVGTTSTHFKLRLVYHSSGQAIKAWYDPTALGAGWEKLDSMTLNEFSPGMATTNTFSFASLGNTDWGPIAEGEIWDDDFPLTGGSPSPTLLVILTADPDFGFRLTGPAGRNVVVKGSPNLTDWSPLQTNRLGNTPLPFKDPGAAGRSIRFYRGRLTP